MPKRHPSAAETPPAPSPGREVRGIVSLPSVVRAAFAVLAIVAGVLITITLQRIIVLFLLGLLLATVIDPGVRYLRRWRVQPSLAILLHYAVFLTVAMLLVFSLVPVIAKQVGEIARLADTEVQRMLTERTISVPLLSQEMNVRLTILLRMTLRNLALNGPDALERISAALSGVAAGSVQFLTGLAGSVLAFVRDAFIVMLSAFFLQIDHARIYAWFRRFFPERMWPYLDERAQRINDKLGHWIRGQLMLCCIIGGMTFVILTALKMPYALTLALLAGFTEFIPYVGPLFGAVPAIMIALAEGGMTWGIVITAAYYVIQFTENNFLVPLIMKHAVDLPATAIIIAALVGVSFPWIIHPVLGMLIAIPIASIADIFLRDVREGQKRRNTLATQPA